MTVPVDETPPATVVGVTETPIKVAGLIVSVAFAVMLLIEAVMFAVVTVDTPSVVTVKVVICWPAGIVTVAGTTAAGLSEEREMTTPPAPDGLLSVTVPVEDPPLTTADGATVRLFKTPGP